MRCTAKYVNIHLWNTRKIVVAESKGWRAVKPSSARDLCLWWFLVKLHVTRWVQPDQGLNSGPFAYGLMFYWHKMQGTYYTLSPRPAHFFPLYEKLSSVRLGFKSIIARCVCKIANKLGAENRDIMVHRLCMKEIIFFQLLLCLFSDFFRWIFVFIVNIQHTVCISSAGTLRLCRQRVSKYKQCWMEIDSRLIWCLLLEVHKKR